MIMMMMTTIMMMVMMIMIIMTTMATILLLQRLTGYSQISSPMDVVNWIVRRRLYAVPQILVSRSDILSLVVKEWTSLEHVPRRLIVISTMTGRSVCLADPLEVGSQTTVSCPQAEDDRLMFSVMVMMIMITTMSKITMMTTMMMMVMMYTCIA